MQTAPQKPSTSDTKKALLGLLQNRKRGPPTPEVIPGPIIKQPLDRTAAVIGPIVTETANEASRDVSLTPSNNEASIAPIRNPKRKRQSSDTPPTRNGSDEHTLHGMEEARKRVSDDRDVLVIETERESLEVNGDLNDEISSGAAVDVPSIKIRRSRPSGPSLPDVAQSPASALLEPSVQSIEKLTSSTPSQKGGRTRIGTRDVRIRKDQETLLSRADCK